MHRHQISSIKRNALRRCFIAGDYNSHRLAKELRVSTVTTWRYGKEFERIRQAYPDKLADMNFYMPEPRQHWQTPLYKELMRLLPRLLAAERPGVKAKPVWRKYLLINPAGYRYLPFTALFYDWLATNKVPRAPNLLSHIEPADLKTLYAWRHSNDRRKWQIAVALEMATQTAVVVHIQRKIESTHRTVTAWLDAYRKKGLAGLELPKKLIPPVVAQRMKARHDQVVRLLHESPGTHGLNRTSWTITALHLRYNELYAPQVSWSQVAYTLKHNGYQFKKSRDVLTSQDPNFREKINRIQRTLEGLAGDEKFFSIDEYGPVGIKIKGGRMLKRKGEAYDVPDKQKHKGVIICTAALELSTNQVKYFYSLRKNTFETIKLVDMLAAQYRDQRRIYLSWDNVSWHRSKILTDHIAAHNMLHTPEIRLVPLPSCTQFLNVIESVFAGLARAVIHNSDYGSVEECKAAVDRHFADRNLHFQLNPKRAGNKIWGKEPVAPEFSDTQVCRKRHAMAGNR
jgi:transposase